MRSFVIFKLLRMPMLKQRILFTVQAECSKYVAQSVTESLANGKPLQAGELLGFLKFAAKTRKIHLFHEWSKEWLIAAEGSFQTASASELVDIIRLLSHLNVEIPSRFLKNWSSAIIEENRLTELDTRNLIASLHLLCFRNRFVPSNEWLEEWLRRCNSLIDEMSMRDLTKITRTLVELKIISAEKKRSLLNTIVDRFCFLLESKGGDPAIEASEAIAIYWAISESDFDELQCDSLQNGVLLENLMKLIERDNKNLGSQAICNLYEALDRFGHLDSVTFNLHRVVVKRISTLLSEGNSEIPSRNIAAFCWILGKLNIYSVFNSASERCQFLDLLMKRLCAEVRLFGPIDCARSLHGFEALSSQVEIDLASAEKFIDLWTKRTLDLVKMKQFDDRALMHLLRSFPRRLEKRSEKGKILFRFLATELGSRIELRSRSGLELGSRLELRSRSDPMNVPIIGAFLSALAQVQLRPSEKWYENVISAINIEDVRKLPRKHFISMILAITQLNYSMPAWIWQHLSDLLLQRKSFDIASLGSIAYCIALISVFNSSKENYDFEAIRSPLESQLNSVDWEKIPAHFGHKVITQFLLYKSIYGISPNSKSFNKHLDSSVAALESQKWSRSSEMHLKIFQKLQAKLPVAKIVPETFIAQIGSHVDAVIDGQTIVQFDGPTHFYRDFPSGKISDKITVATRLNTMALERNGFKVLRISLIKESEKNFDVLVDYILENLKRQ